MNEIIKNQVKPAFSGCKTSVRIKEWSPVVSKVLQYCEIIKIYTNDFTSVPAKYRLAAALGSYEEATDEKEKEKEAKDRSWISSMTS